MHTCTAGALLAKNKESPGELTHKHYAEPSAVFGDKVPGRRQKVGIANLT
jgi:hypothetical protein